VLFKKHRISVFYIKLNRTKNELINKLSESKQLYMDQEKWGAIFS